MDTAEIVGAIALVALFLWRGASPAAAGGFSGQLAGLEVPTSQPALDASNSGEWPTIVIAPGQTSLAAPAPTGNRTLGGCC